MIGNSTHKVNEHVHCSRVGRSASSFSATKVRNMGNFKLVTAYFTLVRSKLILHFGAPLLEKDPGFPVAVQVEIYLSCEHFKHFCDIPTLC